MLLRPTVSFGTSGRLHNLLQAALQNCADRYSAEIAWPGAAALQGAGLEQCQSFSQLLARRPDLVITENFGSAALQAVAFRTLYRKTQLLLLVTTSGRIGARGRFVLRNADGVLAHASATQSLLQAGVAQSRIFPIVEPFEAGQYGSCPGSRSEPDAHRIAYCGALTPEAGILDFLLCAVSWAEQNPTRTVDIWWIGDGDLRGVLEAQPTPKNLTQRFLAGASTSEIVSIFAQCGILIVPSLSDEQDCPIAEAMAAGLVIIGNRRNSAVQKLVHDGETGWLFDPYSPPDLLRVLDLALRTPPHLLDHMRSAARGVIASMSPHSVAERMSVAVSAILHPARMANDPIVAAS